MTETSVPMPNATFWVHCTPQLVERGATLCPVLPRRSCQCPDGGSHDHLVDRFWAQENGVRPIRKAPAPTAGGIYEHWKGPLYLVLGVATDSNNTEPHEEPQVVYISIESTDRTGWPFHVRSLSEFNERFVPRKAAP